MGERANTPVVVGGLAVVSTWEGSLTAFDLADGRVAWRTALPGPAIGPAATDGSVVAATWESAYGEAAGAVVVEGGDGRQRWSVPLEPGGVGGPAIVGLPGGGGGAGVGGGGRRRRHRRPCPRPGRRPRAVADRHRGPGLARGPAPAPSATARSSSPTGGRGSCSSTPAPEPRSGSARPTGPRSGAGPPDHGPEGPFAFPIDDGRLFLVGPGLEPNPLDWPGRVSGVAMTPDGLLLVATREARANYLIALALDTA